MNKKQKQKFDKAARTLMEYEPVIIAVALAAKVIELEEIVADRKLTKQEKFEILKACASYMLLLLEKKKEPDKHEKVA